MVGGWGGGGHDTCVEMLIDLPLQLYAVDGAGRWWTAAAAAAAGTHFSLLTRSNTVPHGSSEVCSLIQSSPPSEVTRPARPLAPGRASSTPSSRRPLRTNWRSSSCLPGHAVPIAASDSPSHYEFRGVKSGIKLQGGLLNGLLKWDAVHSQKWAITAHNSPLHPIPRDPSQ